MNTRATDDKNVIIRHNGIQQGALVSIAIFLLIQTFGAIWWASSASTTLAYLKQDVMQIKLSMISAVTQYNSLQNDVIRLSSKVESFELLLSKFEKQRGGGL